MVGQQPVADLYLQHRQRRAAADSHAYLGAYSHTDTKTHAVTYKGANAYAKTHADTHNGADADAFAGAGSGQWVACGCRQRVGNVDLDAWRERYDALCGGNQAVRFVGGAD